MGRGAHYLFSMCDPTYSIPNGRFCRRPNFHLTGPRVLYHSHFG
ncbi:uncharacterized protein G2W53_024068 [Senna tora]|uniref:Uncharacterized protein n=1 Tax=Senna tora TaxID=362788 RepID=A0A834WF37_9FABA|nr:uncharacterized protein G2W53_024068 [Senna tora]